MASGQHSLAHELALAMMPESSTGSRLLAEELGIEYDEGAEGIDENTPPEHADEPDVGDTDLREEAPEINGHFDDNVSQTSSSGSRMNRHLPTSPSQQDANPMAAISRSIEETNALISHLRRIDNDNFATVERTASDIIRRLNDSARDREVQLRDLFECDRELRAISGQIGGDDVLGRLDPLDDITDSVEPRINGVNGLHTSKALLSPITERFPTSQEVDWETDPDHMVLGDGDEDEDAHPAYVPDAFPPPPALQGPVTPRSMLPQLEYSRTVFSSVVSSLNAISEHAQEFGAGITDSGRKLRAFKNRVAEMRTEWEGAEQSQRKIEQWEADRSPRGADGASGRPDGRSIVEAELQAFSLALQEAADKTQAIMASA